MTKTQHGAALLIVRSYLTDRDFLCHLKSPKIRYWGKRRPI